MFFIKKFFKKKTKKREEFSSEKLMRLDSDDKKREYLISYSREEIQDFFKTFYEFYAHRIEEYVQEFNNTLTDKKRSFRNKEYMTYMIQNKISNDIGLMNSQVEKLIISIKPHSYLKTEDIENIKENFRILSAKAWGITKELRDKLNTMQQKRATKSMELKRDTLFRELTRRRGADSSGIKALLESLVDKPAFLVENYLKWLLIKNSLENNLVKVDEILGLEEVSSEQKLKKLKDINFMIEEQLDEMDLLIQKVESTIEKLKFSDNLTTEQEEILIECSRAMSFVKEFDYNYTSSEREKINHIKNKLTNEAENDKLIEQERETLSNNSVDGIITSSSLISTAKWW